MNDVEDADLLARARRGDTDAFAELFARHQRAIYRYAAYMCGHDTADDVVQETFLAVLRQRDRHDLPKGPAGAYLMGIARHLAVKRLASRYEMPPTETLDDEAPTNTRPDRRRCSTACARAESVKVIRAAVQERCLRSSAKPWCCASSRSSTTRQWPPSSGVRSGPSDSRLHRARALLTQRLRAVPETIGPRRE